VRWTPVFCPGVVKRLSTLEPNGRPTSSPALWVLGLLALTGAVYARVGVLGFVEFDDPQYVSENPHVLAGLGAESLRYAFTTTELGNWHPLTWISHQAVAQFFGAAPGAHHFANLLLHAACVALFFLFLARTTGRTVPSALATALFAAHPLHVESVAWVAERKDVLSTFFWLCALLAYARWTRSRRAGDYALVVLAFVAGLASKQMLVTLPLSLLLVDLWPLGRVQAAGAAKGESLRALIVEKLPLFALSALSSVVTLVAQRSEGAMEFGAKFELHTRAANALRSVGVYLLQTVWPTDLAVYYPYPSSLAAVEVLGGAAALAALLAGAWLALRRAPFVTMGCAWFVVTLLPVLGFVQVGGQAHADRYTYVPHLGLFAALAFGLERWVGATRAFALGALAVIACAFASVRQVAVWSDERSLFEHAVRVTRDNALANDHLAQALQAAGELVRAEQHYREVVRVSPDSAKAHVNLGTLLDQRGDARAAAECYVRALELDANAVLALSNLAVLRAKESRFDEARSLLERALAIDPSKTGVRMNLALTEFVRGDQRRALDALREALSRDPKAAELVPAPELAWIAATSSDAALRDGKLALAVAEHRLAACRAPDPALLELRAAAEAELGRFAEAFATAGRALECASSSPELARRIEFARAGYAERRPLRLP
jgi:Flp pilus assembly protein TadD